MQKTFKFLRAFVLQRRFHRHLILFKQINISIRSKQDILFWRVSLIVTGCMHLTRSRKPA